MAKTKSAFKTLKIAYEDIERKIVKDDKIVQDIIPVDLQKKIVKQVDEEYEFAYPFNEAKRLIQLARLKLYNNQRRDPAAVGDPLLFTVFNTVHAALYDDRLMANWEGRGGEGDEDVEENLNALSSYDYDIMLKSEIDYEWNWDAEFFGRSLLLMMDFNRKEGVMAPMPEVIDAGGWIRDPRATSVNGNNARGIGAMRFGGYEIGMTYWEMKNHKAFFNIQALRKDKEIKSLMDKAREARDTAQGRENYPPKEEALSKFGNYEFKLLNWFTTIKGKKYLVTLGNRRSTLVRLIPLERYGRWPIIDRALYPLAKDWDGVSIPDLVEDKQRARSLLINLGLKAEKVADSPQYLFDQTRIKNKNDLNFRFNKFIAVDGRVDNAIVPMQKANDHRYSNIILEILDAASQRATATPEIQQGIQPSKERTLGELELVSSKVDTRYSMNAKIYGWSERRFWQLWYTLYKIHFKKKIDEKIVRIQGATAPLWRPLLRDNIIAIVDPDVKIESKVISEAKRQREQQSFASFAEFALQDPENNRRYIQKKLAKLNGMTKEEIDMAFPPTINEIQAEEENELLNLNKLPVINVQDDHRVHISIHSKANQKAKTMAHVRSHKKMMLIRRDRPELFPSEEQPSFGAKGKETGGNQPAPAPPTK